MVEVHPMLEKVARALCRESRDVDQYTPENLNDFVEACWADWLDDARAAVRALMEPDDSQWQAGEVVVDAWSYGHTVATSDLIEAYRAMLLPLVEGEGE